MYHSEVRESMPMRLPTAADIWAAIVRRAREIAPPGSDRFPSLVGPVVAAVAVGAADCSWRLEHCHGSLDELRAIERAVAEIRRTTPFMRSAPGSAS